MVSNFFVGGIVKSAAHFASSLSAVLFLRKISMKGVEIVVFLCDDSVKPLAAVGRTLYVRKHSAREGDKQRVALDFFQQRNGFGKHALRALLHKSAFFELDFFSQIRHGVENVLSVFYCKRAV